MIAHSDWAEGSTRLLHHYRNIGSLGFPLPAQYSYQEHQGPTLQTWMLGPSFPSPICPWLPMGDGSVSGIHACLSSFQLITSRAKGGTSYGMAISFHQSLPDPPRAMISLRYPHYHDIPATVCEVSSQCASTFPVDGQFFYAPSHLGLSPKQMVSHPSDVVHGTSLSPLDHSHAICHFCRHSF